jgi:hypothetical protein
MTADDWTAMGTLALAVVTLATLVATPLGGSAWSRSRTVLVAVLVAVQGWPGGAACVRLARSGRSWSLVNDRSAYS